MASSEDDEDSTRPAYGTTRTRRASVTYSEVERAATALLKAGQRPTIERLREHLKGGAPDTIASALSRYWRDLGNRIEGDPVVLSRLPAEVADLAEGIWQRALSLAGDAAEQRLGVDRDQVESFRRRNELQSHSLSLREKELDSLVRARERTVQELESHLRTVMGLLAQKEETIRSLEARVHAAEADAEAARKRLTGLIQKPGSSRPRRRPAPAAARRGTPATSKARGKSRKPARKRRK